MPISYLLLGGNLGDRQANLVAARNGIAAFCGKVVAVSELYETEAWGLKEQAPFLNQALAVDTPLSAEALLDMVLTIEASLGRVRDEKYGPRTIDIDLLFYDDAVISLPQLSIPHPHLHQRRFALVCLNDIAPQLIHPVLSKSVTQLLADCPDDSAVYKF
jgi:2-amino-4-hydroxy-6-hydroxymethyldihydropteridine diphosphokinase